MIQTLLVALLVTQVPQRPETFENWQGFNPFGGAVTEAMELGLVTSGPGFDCTGATSCVSWDGSALVETSGLTWTQNGTVPQVAASTLPTTASSGAAGPFSDANYYSNGTGADALDSTGDRFGCVAFVPVTGANNVLISNGASGSAGHYVYQSPAGSFQFISNVPAAQVAVTANVVSGSGFNVGCYWRTANNISAKLNLGTTATVAAGAAETNGTAQTLFVGRYNAAGQPTLGKILHVMQGLGACPVPPAPFAATCEGWATYQMKRQFGLLGTRGEEITFTRATTATNEVNGAVWNVPAAVPRITTQGMLIERASTNYVLNNRTHPKTAEATGSITATQACVGWHEGTGTMTIANGTATTTGLSCTAVSPGTLCTFNVTVTGTMAITTSAGTVTKAQIECPGSTKTSEIPTPGTATARNADVATVPTTSGLSPSRWCVEVVGTPYTVWNSRAGTQLLWNTYAGALANSTWLNVSNTSVAFPVYDSAGVVKTQTFTHGFGATSTPHRFSAANSNGTLALRVDGASVGTVSGAGTGVQTAFLGTLTLGSQSGLYYHDGYLRDLRIYRSPSCR